MNKNNLLCVIVFALLTLGGLGCASNSPQQTTNKAAYYDQAFFRLIEQYKADPQSVSYSELWNAYLKSTQPTQTVFKHEVYLTEIARVEANEIACTEVEWEAIVSLNYWSIKPHLSAADCYRQNNNQAGIDFHEGFVSFILQGVFGSGIGEHYYDAYEAASWGDVQDVIELAGYTYIDTYLDLRCANQGVYYVVVAEDSESGVQRLFYFDNIRFINRVMGMSGRVNSTENSLGFTVSTSLANSVGHAAIALGDILAAGEEYEAAAEWYLKNTLRESPVAYLRLAELCLKKQITDHSEEACLEFVTKAAELNYFEAYILLSGLYSEGILVDKDPQLAKDFLTIAYEKYGEAKSIAGLGDYYVSGMLGKEKRYKKAMKYYKEAANKGWVSDSYVRLLSFQFAKKELKEKDYQQTLKQLADKGNALAQFKYGALFLVEAEESKDPKIEQKALKYIQLAADQLLPRALYAMGVIYEYGVGVEKSPEKSADYWLAAAIRWNAAAQYEIATLLEKKFDSSSKKMAFEWMYSSARQGDDDAMVSLGYYYEHGTGTEIDLNKAFEYYQKAASENNVTGLYNYAYFLRYGKGVKIDLEKAMEYFLKASKKGSAGAANEIGIMYDEGVFVEKDYVQAVTWYTKSAKRGYRWAQFNLGTMYEGGLGIEKDLSEALKWYTKAAAQGHLGAQRKMLLLKNQIAG